jgi:hypothetical protein
MTSEQYLTFASKARREAAEYREAAETANDYWRPRHLRSAISRDEHADFYEACTARTPIHKDAA